MPRWYGVWTQIGMYFEGSDMTNNFVLDVSSDSNGFFLTCNNTNNHHLYIHMHKHWWTCKRTGMHTRICQQRPTACPVFAMSCCSFRISLLLLRLRSNHGFSNQNVKQCERYVYSQMMIVLVRYRTVSCSFSGVATFSWRYSGQRKWAWVHGIQHTWWTWRLSCNLLQCPTY